MLRVISSPSAFCSRRRMPVRARINWRGRLRYVTPCAKEPHICEGGLGLYAGSGVRKKPVVFRGFRRHAFLFRNLQAGGLQPVRKLVERNPGTRVVLRV